MATSNGKDKTQSFRSFLMRRRQAVFMFVAFPVLVLRLGSSRSVFGFRVNSSKKLPAWREGFLDLHHLQVGSSVSSFVIFPDGTTMLVDAGDLNLPQTLLEFSAMGPPFDTLKLKPTFPNDSQTPVDWIIDYMKEFWPTIVNPDGELDYLLQTHFHADHVGDGNPALRDRPMNANGKYVLSGVSELASKVKVKKIIDRGFPEYNIPQDLRTGNDKNAKNYITFVDDNKDSIHFETFHVGSTRQITMQREGSNRFKNHFSVQVLKCNLHVAPPFNPDALRDGAADTHAIEHNGVSENSHGNENTLSAAFVIKYGNFRYYEGADQEIVRNQDGETILDTIGPTAKAAGKVDVATLNHHGHGVTKDYMEYIDPPIMILKGWSSDQPPKKSMEIIDENKGEIDRKIFATDIFQERLDDIGPTLSKMFAATSGHIVVRVHPPPQGGGGQEQKQMFEIVVLDGNRRIKANHGPFSVRSEH